ncbi:iron chelate uptake ABC transporter family permease subunit [Arthrobacter sp. N199823]|uniref:FecCD family ABC transporter permease n=3 Tax=unclassified Arthrobacter TaxID=235627 RepID=UPI0021575949|nr:iron chelate uptake ABC transporter family permease subunit [Arthrobacter sp. N199823]
MNALRIPAAPRTVVVGIVLLATTALLGVLAMQTGTISFSFREVMAAVFGLSDNPQAGMVIHRIRLPRTVTAIGVGLCLGAAGATFQSISRNALGSPDIIGFTTGAATGAVAQIILFNAGPAATALAAIAGGLLAAAVVYALSVRGGVSGGYRLILVGIGIGAMLGAVNTLLLLKGNEDLALQAQMWLSGSLAARTWEHAVPVAAAVVLLLPVLLVQGRSLGLLEMGDDVARALGVRVEASRLTSMAAAVGLTAVATAAVGPIAFVALAAPQLAARLTRSVQVPLGTGALMGAALMVACDLLTQRLPMTVHVPIGLMTGLVGGCYLLWLVTRSRSI